LGFLAIYLLRESLIFCRRLLYAKTPKTQTLGVYVTKKEDMMMKQSGLTLLNNSLLNKGTAFTQAEREAYGLEGFLPINIESEESQVTRVKEQLKLIDTDLQKYIYLMNLQDYNETLFYRLLMSDPEKYLPIVYDPTVGEACLKFGHIYRRPRGLYLSLQHQGKVKEILQQRPEKDVRFIVVTDGSRILGLGDLGANGMGIPIGKLALYTATAGVPPQYQLPVFFDMGTDNISLLNDPLYLGLREHRIEDERYYDLMDEFINAVQAVYPQCCIQFEDFANYKAIGLLEKYRDKICMFNDDIQGTASVTVAGFYSAKRYTHKDIKDHTILFLGAGSAAHGIADLLCYAMRQEGLSAEEAKDKCWMFDTKGLVVTGRERLEPFKEKYAKNYENLQDFAECIRRIQPTAIIGVSTTPNLFTQEVIEAISKINDHPLIFPLSNPTSQEECTARQAYEFSQGKALFAAGVLFDPVDYDHRVFYPAQANNLWIFPAVGMAICATEATRVTDEMFLVAAKTLANQLSDQQIQSGMLFPPESDILNVSLHISAAVAKVIFDSGLAGKNVQRPDFDDHIINFIAEKCYQPFYRTMTESTNV
jgi:malate dehydrogenase (oxaloacetate-decarboxylating)(NADP+)